MTAVTFTINGAPAALIGQEHAMLSIETACHACGIDTPYARLVIRHADQMHVAQTFEVKRTPEGTYGPGLSVQVTPGCAVRVTGHDYPSPPKLPRL